MGMDWNVAAAATEDGVIALEQGSALGLPWFVQVGEPLPVPGFGACGVVDSLRLPVQEIPSAVLTVVAAEACVAGEGSGYHPCPCQVGPFGMWEEAAP